MTTGLLRWSLPILALALLAPATMARAATPATQSKANASIIHPLTVTKLKDMDFGAAAVTTAGTAVLNPDSDSLSTTGGVTAVGGTPHCADFLGAAQSNSVVNLKVPNQPSTLTRVGGTETMTASNFTLQGGLSKRVLAKSESFTFRVGATLNVAAGQAEGTYVGTFNVTVQYP
jgi:hypothetical protein